MKKNNFGWFVFVVLVVLWSFYEIYPPTSRDLIRQFSARAENQDTNFTAILQQVQVLQQTNSGREFANLEEAIGTNDIQNYFPSINARDQLHPTTYILNQIQRDAAGKIKLGLDLQGGTEFLVEMDTNKLVSSSDDTNKVTSAEDISGALSQAVEVLRKRVDAFGVAEPEIKPAGGNRILIQLPGLSEADKNSAMTNIQKAAYLEFRLVKDDSQQIIDDNEPIPPGYEMLKHFLPPQDGKPQPPEVVIVSKKAANGLHGDIVTRASMGRGQMGDPEIDFTLTDDAGARFGQVTRDNMGKRLAIILDGELYSAPTINGEIDKNGQITGHFTDKEAQDLASVLQNPLRAPLSIVYSRTFPRRWALTRFTTEFMRPSPPSFSFRCSCWRIIGSPDSPRTSRSLQI